MDRQPVSRRIPLPYNRPPTPIVPPPIHVSRPSANLGHPNFGLLNPVNIIATILPSDAVPFVLLQKTDDNITSKLDSRVADHNRLRKVITTVTKHVSKIRSQ